MYTKVMTSQEKPAKILAFVGLPGAGKTEATNFVAAKGFPKIYGGGIASRISQTVARTRRQRRYRPPCRRAIAPLD